MAPLTESRDTPSPGLGVLRRFIPYLWPRDNPGLRARVIGAFVLVLIAKAVTLFGAYPL
jgi:ATP-binding cassette, subfamily B, heavy metal transporter